MDETGLDGVTVRFDDGRPVLRGITLLAGPGEVLALVGPSGSGKTTALRAVAGLERVAAGRVLVRGRDVTRVGTPQRGVAMVFQQSALAPFLDVGANLEWAATFGEPVEPGRVAERARRFRLSHLLRRRPSTLSPGEAGRAGVARALVRTPSAFLFDEPLAHLDAAGRAQARRAVLETVRAGGSPALWVSHDQAEALAVADRLAVLRDGTVAQLGPPGEVYARPVDVYVAGFLGDPEMALLPARAVDAPGGAGYTVGPRTLPLWGPLPAGVGAGREVLLGLRAQAVGAAGDPAAVALPAVVGTVRPDGPSSLVVADLAVAGEADGARIAARLPGSPRVGAAVELGVDARRAHVFDRATGLALHHPGAHQI